jgi:phosphoglycolate phosphatase-like HAD superfamily hydrolase
MDRSSRIKQVVLDFDGTCTQVPEIFRAYLENYLKGFRAFFTDEIKRMKLAGGDKLTASDWENALSEVRCHSPKAGWTLAGCPSAPAAADPYILADESAKLILRRRGIAFPTIPFTVGRAAYESCVAPWRPEVPDVFAKLISAGIKLHIVSNSSSAFIAGRLKDLFGADSSLMQEINVQSDAGKFRVTELTWEDSSVFTQEARNRFASLPVACSKSSVELGRPLYLRRGTYFEAIHKVIRGNWDELATTLFCGDIWEMDLAMPFALGGCVQLIERAMPFETYPYEKQLLQECGERGRFSQDLSGLLSWI